MRRLSVVTLALLVATSVSAQELAAPLQDVSACRIDDERIALSLKFESSPCWETVEPVVGEASEPPAEASVTIGTQARGEVCVMSIVIAEYAQAIEVPAPISAIEVTVTTPEGTPVGMSTAAIAESEGCTAPAN